MVRFFGMMPSDEIEVEKAFKCNSIVNPNLTERIQAGPNGWTVLWADGGSTFKDESIGTEENFKNALACLKESFPDAEELEFEDDEEEIMEEE